VGIHNYNPFVGAASHTISLNTYIPYRILEFRTGSDFCFILTFEHVLKITIAETEIATVVGQGQRVRLVGTVAGTDPHPLLLLLLVKLEPRHPSWHADP